MRTHPLPPGLGLPPCPRPRRDLSSIPYAPSNVLGDWSGKARLAHELMCSLLGDAEKLGDVDEADSCGLGHAV